MANWTIIEQEIGLQPIETTSTTKLHDLGKIVRAVHATYGVGEFIYLLGVASTAVGNLVIYDGKTYQTALSPNTANQGRPVGLAMSANVASQYGWYMIQGTSPVLKTAAKISPAVAVFQSATTGRIFPTATTGKQVLGARSANAATIASATSSVDVLLNRPFMQGQII